MTDFPRRTEAPGVHPDAPELVAAGIACSGLMVATPMGGGGLADQAFIQGFADLRVECARRGIVLQSVFLRHESDVQQARNRCFASFLASDCSHLLFIDADIGFSADAALRLMAHAQPVVGATYAKKAQGPTQYAVSLGAQTRVGPGGLLDVPGLPGGFLMIHRTAAERMAGAYRDLAFDPHDGDPSRDGWRGCLLNIFDDDLSDRTRWSEDLAFCRRWRAIGGTVWLDPHILLQHWGMACFSGHPAEMFQPRAVAG